MKFVLLLLMLTTSDAGPRDLSDKMFIFPQQSNTARVRLTTARQDFNALTVCLRSFTPLKRDHALFSLATRSFDDAFLIFWDEANKEMETHVMAKISEYGREDYKRNMWHSICTTWDSSSGLAQLWLDGQPSMKKFVSSGTNITGSTIIILGQEQDSHGGAFDRDQSFIGMMSDVHMWDHTLSPCEIQKYMGGLNFTQGNVLNWSALEFKITDKVVIEDKQTTCY